MVVTTTGLLQLGYKARRWRR